MHRLRTGRDSAAGAPGATFPSRSAPSSAAGERARTCCLTDRSTPTTVVSHSVRRFVRQPCYVVKSTTVAGASSWRSKVSEVPRRRPKSRRWCEARSRAVCHAGGRGASRTLLGQGGRTAGLWVPRLSRIETSAADADHLPGMSWELPKPFRRLFSDEMSRLVGAYGPRVVDRVIDVAPGPRRFAHDDVRLDNCVSSMTAMKSP